MSKVALQAEVEQLKLISQELASLPVAALNNMTECFLVRAFKGHKFFVSAPMCNAFLMLAQTENSLSCFLIPSWRPDGSKNPLQVLRLKDKMGNASNASSMLPIGIDCATIINGSS